MAKLDDLSMELLCLTDHYAARQFWKKGTKCIRGQLGNQYFPKRWQEVKKPEMQKKKTEVKDVKEERPKD